MERQRHALTAITASTWVLPISEVVGIYKTVIHSAIACGSDVFHSLTEMGVSQGSIKGTKVVLGAYKGTAIQHRETESTMHPLNL